MTVAETIERVRHVNPLPTDPPAPPIASLLAQLDLSLRSPESALRKRPDAFARASRLPKLALPVAAAAALVLIALALFGRSGGGGPDVATAVERAITPGPGVLHIVTETEYLVEGRPTKEIHEEIWSAQSPRRLHIHTVLSAGGETIESEGAILSTNPPRTLSWFDDQANVITESTRPVSSTEQTPDAWLRQAFQEGRVSVSEHTELDGRPVWRLSIPRAASQSRQTVDGHEIPAPTVLVDASSFTPLESVVYSANDESGHATLETTTTRYLTYQELPATQSNEALLNLANHPGAKIVAEAAQPNG